MTTQNARRRAGAVQRGLFTLLVLAAGLAAAPAAFAQGGGGMMNMNPEERAQQRIGVLTERVQLTAQQAEQLRPVLVKQFTEQTGIFQKYQAGGDRQGMMGEMQALRTKYDEQIQALLTDDQKAKYRTLLEEEAARRRQMMGGGGGR